MFAFGKSNFRLSGQKLFLDFKNPFKILAEAEPRLWRGDLPAGKAGATIEIGRAHV